MAQISIRANLSSVQIPLLTEEFGRSVIMRQQDLNYVPTVTSKADIDKDIGIPQIYYAHNVMPTNYGYRSIAFSSQIPAVSGINTFSQCFPLVSVAGEKAFVGVNTDGSVYVCHPGTGYTWTALTGFYKAIITEGANTGTGYVVSASVYDGAGADVYTATMTSATAFQVKKNGVNEATGTVGTEYVSANSKLKFTINSGDTAFIVGDIFTITLSAATFSGAVTKASIAGESYLCSEGHGIFQYDFTSDKLIWRLAAGLDPTQILGITSSNGYLIAYSIDSVLWSSTVDTLDLVPSLSTGAGGGSVEDAKGPIRRCVGLTSGFLVFTAANCVAATYSSNFRYPFTFKEVPNAGGVSDLSLVTDEADSTAVYAFTSYGLQQISTQRATAIMPELSDFLTGKRFEDFDSTSFTLSVTNSAEPLKKRVEFVSGRFLVISYGLSSFTHAMVYDTALQRFGRVKLDHISVFQYGFLDADDADTPKKQLAFLQSSGLVTTLEFAAGVLSPDSVLLMGKFQYVRSRFLQLDSVELESIDPDFSCNVYDFITLDGKTFEPPVAGYDTGNSGLAKQYNFRLTGSNHTIMIQGTFRLNCLIITFNIHGHR